MTDYIIQRKLSNGVWENIYIPIRILKDDKVIFESSITTIRKVKIIDNLRK